MASDEQHCLRQTFYKKIFNLLNGNGRNLFYMNFEQLNLSKPLLRAVAQAGYTEPSPIQEQAIPPVLEGRDLLGCAQTGTGKTAAFSLPILQQLSSRNAEKKGVVRSLILTPTRELALQIQENIMRYAKYTSLRSVAIFGGVSQRAQVNALRKGADILVATPGRLMDLINQGFIKLDNVEIFVLDEADRMLDMGFVQDVHKIIKLIPEKRQTLLFSATLPPEIVKLVNSLLHDPVKIFIDPETTTVEKIEQRLYKIDKVNKRELLAELLRSPDISSALVFTRTKHGADRVVRDLKRDNITALAIHGDKSQGARQTALKSFKDGKVSVLVATDIAARGIDISELSHVFNYDLPDSPETYVHRIGRTGRAGNSGISISFCSFNELSELKAIQKLIGFPIPEIENHAWPMVDMTPLEKRGSQGRRSAAPKSNSNRNSDRLSSRPSKSTKGKKHMSEQTTTNTPNKKSSGNNAAQKPASHGSGQASSGQNRNGQSKNAQNSSGRPNSGGGNNRKKNFSRPNNNAAKNPYENRTGGQTIITKKPAWGKSAEADPNKGDTSMSQNKNQRNNKNNNRNNGKKKTIV